MSEDGNPSEDEGGTGTGLTLPLVLALTAMGWMALAGVGLIWNGLWVVGVPMAVFFGIWFSRTLLKRPRWRFGPNNARPGGRSRFWNTRP